jgi:hypothetical protein
MLSMTDCLLTGGMMEPDTKPTIVLIHTRAGAHTVEISSSHVAFISHPQETTDLILAAVAGS